MPKKGGSQTVTQSLDPQTQEWIKKIYGAAQTAAGSPGTPVDPHTMQAADFFGGAMKNGNLGMGALNGDPGAMAAFMNPYLDQVVGRVQGDQGRMNDQTIKSVNDYATQAGAFGGDRHGIATGTALADVNRTGMDRIAALRSGGFSDAMGRAGQAANLGMGAAGALGDLGSYIHGVNAENDPSMRYLNVLRGGLLGLPTGATSTQTQKSNPWNTALGLAGTLGGFLLGGPGGAAAGAGIFGPGGGDDPGGILDAISRSVKRGGVAG